MTFHQTLQFFYFFVLFQVDNAFEYGRNIGIAFQLIDDLLDFEASAEMLG